MYSEAFNRYGSKLFRPIFHQLIAKTNFLCIPEVECLGRILLVDGSLFPAISTMQWASYKSTANAIKIQLAFDLNKMTAAHFLVKEGNYSEKKFLKDILEIGSELNADKLKNLLCYCDVSVDENDFIYTYSNIKNAIIYINPNTDEIIEIPVVFDINSIFCYLSSYVWEGPNFSLDNLLAALCRTEYAHCIETIKESAICTNSALTQIVCRYFREGEPDVGIHHQEGKNGQHIMDMILQES